MSIILRRRNSITLTTGDITNDKLPHYVKFEGSGGAMRLRYGNEYWRDAGLWGVEFKIDNGVLRVNEPSGPMAHMNNCPLIEISMAKWAEDNGGYTPSNWTVQEEREGVDLNDLAF